MTTAQREQNKRMVVEHDMFVHKSSITKAELQTRFEMLLEQAKSPETTIGYLQVKLRELLGENYQSKLHALLSIDRRSKLIEYAYNVYLTLFETSVAVRGIKTRKITLQCERKTVGTVDGKSGNNTGSVSFSDLQTIASREKYVGE
jgi:hypothetical protein